MLTYIKINRMANTPKPKSPKSKSPKSEKKSGHKKSGHKKSGHKKSGQKKSGQKKSGQKKSGHKKSEQKTSGQKTSKEIVARCLPEKKDVKIQNPTIHRNKKNGCKYAIGHCSSCGRKVSRILPKDY